MYVVHLCWGSPASGLADPWLRFAVVSGAACFAHLAVQSQWEQPASICAGRKKHGRILESFRLEKTLSPTPSHPLHAHWPCLSMPHLYDSWAPPGMGTPLLPHALVSLALEHLYRRIWLTSSSVICNHVWKTGEMFPLSLSPLFCDDSGFKCEMNSLCLTAVLLRDPYPNRSHQISVQIHLLCFTPENKVSGVGQRVTASVLFQNQLYRMRFVSRRQRL